ncbi:MAG: DUF3732 domain-containing protein [Ruminococcus sp.]|nr:DUF3732 domain-containing protein [Ruminococcus sp.]MCM1392123.1 DUF3732 domain-containing protein [Ruminococcus sp.]
MQISAIVLYGINGEKRILPFNTGSVNIITGKSKTGKSVIGDIIDYCFGGTSCNIAEGFVRERVAWYALQLVHNDEYLLIARENPPHGQASTNSCCYLVGAKNIPSDLTSATPIDNNGLEKLLSSKLGISENLFNPPENQSRLPLSANIRHSLYYCLQNQDEIASQKFLFHRQAEPFMAQAIKDTLPYFLGIVGEDTLMLESERTQLKREAAILRKNIDEVEQLKGNGLERATTLLSEAKEVGILAEDIQINLADYESVRNAMNLACTWQSNDIATNGMDRISLLQSQLSHTRNEIDQISIDIRNTEEFLGQIRGYSTEVEHQKNRLESIGLFEQIDFDPNHCPLCSKAIDTPLPGAQDIRDSITRLSNRLESVSRERPALREHLDQLNNKRQELINQSQALQVEINAIYDENKEALHLKDLNVRRGRVVGRISLWLESVVISDNMADRRAKLSDIESRISEINSILDADEIEERKQSIINRISTLMYQWAKILDLEHSEFPYRFDLTKLTVMVDRDRPVPLQQLGSGSNWLGCHLITLFALHTFFIQNKRPVPGFLFLDQPSQVYFPPETNDENVDSQEVRKIYDFVFERIKELAPNMQVIIVDHADINEKRFQDSVVEKWWDGTKLVPIDWA